MKISKLQINNIDQVKLIRILFCLVFILVFSYVYLVNVMTFDIAQKSKITEQIFVANSKVSDLELALVDKKKQISRELAQEFGLTQAIEDKTIFVLRGKNTRLTFNE